MTTFTVVANDCEAPALHNVLHVRGRTTEFGEQNFRFRFDKLAAGLPDRLTDRQMDWLELLGFVYAADRACRRGEGDLDWVRSIELFVPMRDPEFWEQHATALQEIFGSLTDDRLVLHFRQEEVPADPPRQRREPFPAAAGIALLSGGMDSFVAALSLIQDSEQPLLFLSHSAGGATNTAQATLRPILSSLHPSCEFPLLTADTMREFPGQENSQRSRTLLYVAAAALVASASGLRDVYLNENGVMAIHVPMSEARIGSYSTRTASPQLLDDMGALASAVLGREIVVRNVLLNRTKPDVAELGVGLGFGDRLKDTVSCWSIGRTRQHCGYCAPCIMRRISCELHGIADVDYGADIFDDPVVTDTNPRAQDNVVHLCALITDFLERNDFELELDYVEIFNGGRQLSASEAVTLHRRWAEQAHAVISQHPVAAKYL
jgi:7-cyano-7-deazaguanine synthase in queuosine biosynthesis